MFAMNKLISFCKPESFKDLKNDLIKILNFSNQISDYNILNELANDIIWNDNIHNILLMNELAPDLIKKHKKSLEVELKNLCFGLRTKNVYFDKIWVDKIFSSNIIKGSMIFCVGNYIDKYYEYLNLVSYAIYLVINDKLDSKTIWYITKFLIKESNNLSKLTQKQFLDCVKRHFINELSVTNTFTEMIINSILNNDIFRSNFSNLDMYYNNPETVVVPKLDRYVPDKIDKTIEVSNTTGINILIDMLQPIIKKYIGEDIIVMELIEDIIWSKQISDICELKYTNANRNDIVLKMAGQIHNLTKGLNKKRPSYCNQHGDYYVANDILNDIRILNFLISRKNIVDENENFVKNISCIISSNLNHLFSDLSTWFTVINIAKFVNSTDFENESCYLNKIFLCIEKTLYRSITLEEKSDIKKLFLGNDELYDYIQHMVYLQNRIYKLDLLIPCSSI
jgi:hypothetical protein